MHLEEAFIKILDCSRNWFFGLACSTFRLLHISNLSPCTQPTLPTEPRTSCSRDNHFPLAPAPADQLSKVISTHTRLHPTLENSQNDWNWKLDQFYCRLDCSPSRTPGLPAIRWNNPSQGLTILTKPNSKAALHASLQPPPWPHLGTPCSLPPAWAKASSHSTSAPLCLWPGVCRSHLWTEFDFLVGPKCAGQRLHNLTFLGSTSRQGPAPATSNAKRSRWCSFVNQQHFQLSSHFQAPCLEPYCLPLLWVTAQAGESSKMTMKTGVDTKSTNQAQSGEHQFH